VIASHKCEALLPKTVRGHIDGLMGMVEDGVDRLPPPGPTNGSWTARRKR